MKHQKHPFFLDATGNIKYKHRRTLHDIFASTQQVSFVDQRFTTSDKLNVIGVAPACYAKLSFQKLLLINFDTGTYTNVSVKPCDTISETEFVATSYLKELLALENDSQVYLCEYKDLKYDRIYPQKIDHIRESDLVISEFDHANLCCELQRSPYPFFEIYNTFTQDSIIVKKTHIFVDKTLAPGTIRLSRKQRICLGLELPLYLSNEQWEILCAQLDPSSEDYQLLCELYPDDDHILIKSASYDKKSKAKKLLSRYCAANIKIIPVPETGGASRRGFLRRLCDFYVGKSTVSLVCRRPYDIDEGLDIVRMTKSNMNLLGIDEMDKVILQYKNRRISCRVLALGDREAFAETNLPISHDIVVGVPAHIRKKLHVMDLSSSIKIDRDTSFIFKKSINEQIVPILLTLFSTNLFTDSSVIVSALLSLVAIPIVLFFNLSSKRNMRT